MRHRIIHTLQSLLLIALLVRGGWLQAQPNPQYAHGYEFSFGITSEGWVNLTHYHEMDPLLRTTPLEDFGFSFWFFDHGYRTLSINSQGGIRFGTRFAERYRDIVTPFPSSFRNAYRWKYHTPYIIPFGMSLYQGPGSYARWGVVGEPGQRKVVCDFSMSRNDSLPAIYKCQVQLSEADGSVLYLYKPVQDTVTAFGNAGMAYDPYHFVTINSNTSYASAEVDSIDRENPNLATIWPPGNMCYYRLRPNYPKICANAARLYPRHVQQTTAEVCWRRNPLDAYYLYEVSSVPSYSETWVCDTLGLPLKLDRMQTGQVTTDTLLRLTGLQPGAVYEVRVATVCVNGDTSSTQKVRLYTYGPRDADNQFDYANIYAANVTGHNGNYTDAFLYDEMFDFGHASEQSRQTVLSHLTERDTLTNDGLLRVSSRFSHSVLLGDTNSGSLSEGLTYTIDVDTLNYDILLVSFALVEQSPEHGDPPRVTIEFLNDAGELTDSCNRVDILANDFTGNWHPGRFGREISFKSWSQVGLDLAPYQGQRIRVRLTNYDCGQGLHFGYCYYAIESGTKHLRTNTCMSSSHMAFYAPEGFVYRWYRPTNPSLTLSTADSLVVYQPGYYCCWCGYKHDPTCGFELKGYAGPRTPVAAFHAEPLDSCGFSYRFVNESFVTMGEHNTPVPGLTPEAYVWRFDDGTTSTADHPVHEFTEGTHQVELVALIGGGLCRDSVVHAVTMEVGEAELYDSVCIGGRYPFHDTILSTQGTYTHTYGCRREVLHLHTFKPFEEGHTDTVCLGDGIWVRDHYYDDGDYHTFVVPGPYGCDSLYWTQLNVREWPVPEFDISQTCDSLAYYTIDLAPGWAYDWSSEPLDPEALFLEHESSVQLNPSVPTKYYVGFSYDDAPFCTVTKSFSLDPVGVVSAAIKATPMMLDLDHRSLTAVDVSFSSSRREWFVNGELQPDTGRTIYYELPTDRPVDSVHLMLVAYNISCQDTAVCVVPVYRSQLLFPNIFTPGLPQNHLFLPSGYGVSDYELWIYDRRGVLMFYTDDREQAWDGTSNGQPCQQGSYAYICQYTISTGERKQQAGTVTLIR